MSEWVTFGVPRPSATGKTQIWVVQSDSGEALGEIRWFGRWRKYAFHPAPHTIFEQDCLRSIATFCSDRSRELRQSWKAGGKK